MNKLHGLAPVVSNTTTSKLILGTIPSSYSYEKRKYYAHCNDRFWTIVCEALKFNKDSTYLEKIGFLMSKGYGVWDVLSYAEQSKPTSKNLINPEYNRFESFLKSHSKIRELIFNGDIPFELYKNHFGFPKISYTVLPATTIANSFNRYDYTTIKSEWINKL